MICIIEPIVPYMYLHLLCHTKYHVIVILTFFFLYTFSSYKDGREILNADT